MSVIIQNISKVYGAGTQNYVLRINNKVIAYFDHTFEHGLAVCLEKAAAAARDPNRVEIQNQNAVLQAIFDVTKEQKAAR